MPVVWLKEDVKGAFHFSGISTATRFLAEKGIKLHDTQLHREAKRSGGRNGWCFSFDPNLAANLAAKPSTPQSLTSLLGAAGKVCGNSDAQSGGHLKKCVCCNKNNHELCGTMVVG